MFIVQYKFRSDTRVNMWSYQYNFGKTKLDPESWLDLDTYCIFT